MYYNHALEELSLILLAFYGIKFLYDIGGFLLLIFENKNLRILLIFF